MPDQKAALVFASAVPDGDRVLIRTLNAAELAYAGAEGYRPYRRRVQVATAVTTAVLTVVVVGWLLYMPDQLWLLIPVIGGLGMMARLAYAAISVAIGDSSPRRSATAAEALDAAHRWRGQYLTAERFAPDAADLIERFQAAASRITRATTATQTLQDTVSLAALAEQTWQVAQDLAAYSKLRRELPSVHGPAGEEAGTQRALIDERFAKLVQRVEATERLASEAVKRDRRQRAERARDATERRLETTRSEVLDLAAGAARDELAIADTERLAQILAATDPSHAEVGPIAPDTTAATELDDDAADHSGCIQPHLNGAGEYEDCDGRPI